MPSSIAPGPWRAGGLAPGSRCRALLVCGWLAATAPGLFAQPASPAFSDPRTATTAYEQASRLAAEGRRDDAMASLERALREHPRNPQLRFLYGVLLAEGRRTDDAIAVFEQITQDYPELPEPYNNLAVMFAARGDFDRARGALEAAVRALPGYALAHENLGDVHLRLAVRAWERAASLDPTGARVGERLALARALIAHLAPPGTAASPPQAAPAAASPPASR
jgi:tetratricopeptide (TPR) repeat protein